MNFIFSIFSFKAVITFLLTSLPAILLVLYFYLSEKFKIDKKIIIKVFIAGVLITLPAGELNSFILKTFSNDNEINNAFKFALRSKFPSKISEADVYAKK